jgi:hypothetical protein
MFLLDGKPSNFSEEDAGRRNTIVNLLSEWKLLTLVDPDKSSKPITPLSQIKIISHKEKGEWTLITKYSIGNKKRTD